MKNNNITIQSSDKLIDKIIGIEVKLKKLPNLNEVDKAKFEQSIAIDQLYYSSKIEGSILSAKQIDKAIHGTEV
jgi:hypothetical protein